MGGKLDMKNQEYNLNVHASIRDKEYRVRMDNFGSAYATSARKRGGSAIVLRDYGFHNHCPVCIKDEIAEILNLPLNSYWTPDEIGEIISYAGRNFALSLWDTYVSGDSCHLYFMDGSLMTSILQKYRNYIVDVARTGGIRTAFTLIGSTWYIKKIKYDQL